MSISRSSRPIDAGIGTAFDGNSEMSSSIWPDRIYRPLNPERREIRLLYIEIDDDLESACSSNVSGSHSGSSSLGLSAPRPVVLPVVGPSSLPGACLRFKFETISLLESNISFYETVSYFWGDHRERTRIVLDGRDVEIPARAESALRHICHKHGHTPVWLDILCVNQNDAEERAQQASIMSEIYAKAARVLIWLGSGGGQASKARSGIRSLRMGIEKRYPVVWDMPHSWHLEQDAAEALMQEVPSLDRWQAVYSLFANQWFKYARNMRQVTAHSDVLCYLHHRKIQWSELAGLAAWLHCHAKLLPILPTPQSLNGMANIAEVWHLRCRESRIFTNYMQLIASIDRKEPEDIAKTLLEMRISDTMDGAPNKLKPEAYQEPIQHAYARAGQAAISRTRNLLLLKHAQSLRTAPSGDGNKDFPTWAPRLDLRDCSALTPVSSRAFQFNAHDAIPLCIDTHDDPTVLRVQGVLLDEVRDVSPQMHWRLRGRRQGDAVTAAIAIRETFAWARRRLPNWPEGPLARRFAITVASGQDVSGRNFHTARAYSRRLHHGFMSILPDALVQEPLQDRGTSNACADLDRDAMYAVEAMMKAGHHRTIFTTDQGRIGLGTENLQPGDRMCILFGGNVPFTIRRDGEQWRFIGDACVEGIMFVSV